MKNYVKNEIFLPVAVQDNVASSLVFTTTFSEVDSTLAETKQTIFIHSTINLIILQLCVNILTLHIDIDMRSRRTLGIYSLARVNTGIQSRQPRYIQSRPV